MSISPSSADGAPGPTGAGTVGSRNRTFLVAKNDRIAAFSAGPLEFDWLVEQMRADPAITVEATLAPRRLVLQQVGPSIVREVVVATMPDEKAAELELHPQVVLEEDLLVVPLPAPLPPAQEVVAAADAALVSPFGTSTSWQLRLVSATGAPVGQATVYLYGRGVPTQGRTDDDGRITLSLLNESDATVRAVYVNPLRDYWSLWVDRPALTSGTLNTLVLLPLEHRSPASPRPRCSAGGSRRCGWTRSRPSRRAGRAGGGDRLRRRRPDPPRPGRHRRTASTSPPARPTHELDRRHHRPRLALQRHHRRRGQPQRRARVRPGGRGARGPHLPRRPHQQPARRRRLLHRPGHRRGQHEPGHRRQFADTAGEAGPGEAAGVACIVAAGNTGDAVQFPGVSPDVLTVAAIGRNGTFPDSSYHAQQRWSRGTPDQGYFAAQFSCHGQEVDVCGPGVAIVSSVPDDGFAAWDGTSMATPHITGLARAGPGPPPGLPDPRPPAPTAARVDRLFEILKESATPLEFGDPSGPAPGCRTRYGRWASTPASPPPAGRRPERPSSRRPSGRRSPACAWSSRPPVCSTARRRLPWSRTSHPPRRRAGRRGPARP